MLDSGVALVGEILKITRYVAARPVFDAGAEELGKVKSIATHQGFQEGALARKKFRVRKLR